MYRSIGELCSGIEITNLYPAFRESGGHEPIDLCGSSMYADMSLLFIMNKGNFDFLFSGFFRYALNRFRTKQS